MVNNPILYAAIMTLRHVVFSVFLIISNVSGIVNVMCLVIPAADCLHIWDSLEAIMIVSGLSEVQITKCKIKISLCILEGTNTRASGIMGYFPELLKFQDFWSIISILKELCCIIEAPLDIYENLSCDLL